MPDIIGSRIESRVSQVLFVLAGAAIFTVRNTATGNRFTYKVVKSRRRPDLWAVYVLTGPNNESDYSYVGTVAGEDRIFRPGRTSALPATALSVAAFAWSWSRLAGRGLPANVELWHQGKCGRCRRALTDPESIVRGLGPVCVGLE